MGFDDIKKNALAKLNALKGGAGKAAGKVGGVASSATGLAVGGAVAAGKGVKTAAGKTKEFVQSDKFKEGAKKAGSATLQAGKTVGKGALIAGGAGLGLGLAVGKKGYDSASEKVRGMSQQSGELLFFIMVLVVVIFDALYNFSFSQVTRLVVYLCLAGWAIGVTYKTGRSSQSVIYLSISLASFAIGYIFSRREVISKIPVLKYVILLAPLWMVYFALTEHDNKIVSFFSHLYLWLWAFAIILFIFTGGLSAYIDIPNAPSGINSRNVWNSVLDWFKDKLEKAQFLLLDLQKQASGEDSDTVFSGQVEQNKNKPLGVYIENFGPVEPYIFEGDDINMIADINVKTFVGSITIKNRCYAESGEITIEGEPDPAELKDIIEYEDVRAMCTIPHTQDNPVVAGSYSVHFKSLFNFETWAYTTQTYMDKDFIRSLRAQNRDPAVDYAIVEYPIAVFTNGPLKIEMPSIKQPISVDTEQQDLPSPFGIDLTNNWPGMGRVLKIDELKVVVPEGVILEKCTTSTQPKAAVETISGSEYHTYTFDGFEVSYEQSSYSQISSIKRIFCKMKLNDPKRFIGGSPIKSEKTFAVFAKYQYELYADTSVGVLSMKTGTE